MAWVQNSGQAASTPNKGGQDVEKMEGVESDDRDGNERGGAKDVDFDTAEVEEDFDVA